MDEMDEFVVESYENLDQLDRDLLVRNSVDHGIESREVRVNIEISDDGAGLSTERIRAKGIERGTVSAAEAAQLGERDLCPLIFPPGFSTAKAVTNVSGRPRRRRRPLLRVPPGDLGRRHPGNRSPAPTSWTATCCSCSGPSGRSVSPPDQVR